MLQVLLENRERPGGMHSAGILFQAPGQATAKAESPMVARPASTVLI